MVLRFGIWQLFHIYYTTAKPGLTWKMIVYIQELEKLQTLFLSVLLAVPLSCPRPALSWDTASLSMANRIIQTKLNFAVHLKKLDEDSLAKQVFDEQLENGYPGLAQEAQDLCRKLRIQDLTRYRKEDPTKNQWKQRISEVVKERNEKELKEEIRSKSKLDSMREESYEQKAYLNDLGLNEARMFFRIRTRSIKCKMNQPSSPANKAALWQCSGCSQIDTQSHILYCVAYQQQCVTTRRDV